MLRQMADALRFAHGKGLIHRDIKPENIMFDGEERPLLTDLGIAKAIGSGTRMTKTGMSIGTPHYMSPEQARGKSVDGRSDLYSLGVVFYEMLTGKVPYEAEETLAVAYAHVNEPVPELPTSLAAYQHFIDRLMAKSPEDRFADAAQLVTTVEKVQAGQQVARPASATRVMPHAAPAPADDRLSENGDRSKKSGLLWGLGGALAALLVAGGFYFYTQQPKRVFPGGGGGRPLVSSGPVQPSAVPPSRTDADKAPEPSAADEQRARRQRLKALVDQEQVQRLLSQAGEDLNALRLTSPAGNNALEKYERVLALNSGNPAAQQGIARIVGKYLAMAERSASGKKFEKAEGYLERAEAILPDARGIAELKAKLAVWPGRIFRDRLKDGTPGPQMVMVEGGCFKMGSPAGEKGREDDEGPVHEVCLDGFLMGRYEVTVGQFRKFVQATGYKTDAEKNTGGEEGSWTLVEENGKREWKWKAGADWRSPGFKQTDKMPVACVSWNDARAYIKWLKEQTGKQYTLPSEAQWEYAARAGTITARFWGNDPDKACGYANGVDKTNDGTWSWNDPVHNCEDGYYYAAPVGSFKPNRFGLYDMLGNVREWCMDTYSSSAYSKHARNNPIYTGGSNRVYRGGSWDYEPKWVRSANRNRCGAAYRNAYLGFRLLRKP
jgi:formylglycine-generating enzyme required for sulfatase activity